MAGLIDSFYKKVFRKLTLSGHRIYSFLIKQPTRATYFSLFEILASIG